MQPVRREPWRAFGPAWFARSQRVLLAALRDPLLGRWLRRVLRITRADVGHRGEIVALYPHAYVVANADGTYTLDCRTHWKYAKRIYFAGRPLWWLLHAFDWAIADRWLTAWSFGFTTLTTYPDPDPESATVDGAVRRASVDESFATIIAGAGTNADDNTSNDFATYLSASGTSNQFDQNRRAIFLFNTGAIAPGSQIVSAVISFAGAGKDNGLGSPDAHVVGASPASNTGLAASDYGNVSKTSFGSVTYATWTTDVSYTDITLNGSGLAAIAVGGVSKFGLLHGWDQANSFGGSWSAFATQFFKLQFADTAGTASDPKLVVTYSNETMGYLRPNALRPRIFAPGRPR